MSKRDVLLIVLPILFGGVLLTWFAIDYIEAYWFN